MIASIAVLIFFLWKEGKLQAILSKENDDIDIDAKAIIIETVKELFHLLSLERDSTFPIS